MNRRHRRPNNSESYPKQLLAAIGKFLPQRGLPLISNDRRVRWTDRLLVTAAIIMAWSDRNTLRDAFAFARGCVIRLYPTRRRPGRQFRGFMRTLERAHDELLEIVTAGLRTAMETLGLLRRLRKRWIVMAVDGTRVACPRTCANETAFGTFGKDKTLPQQQLTTIFHVDSGLPWTWRHAPGNVPERTHLRAMIAELPQRTLLLADAGFTGFALMRELQQAGHDFIIRACSTVHLLRKLGWAVREYDGLVYLWPQAQRTMTPPVMLRLVTVRDGRKRVDLLTSVLDRSLLPDADVAAMYRRRWGVEVLFRSLKQTMEKRKLRSRAPHHCQVELDWSLVGLWMLGLMTLEAAGLRRTVDRDRGWSPAGALRIVRECIATQRRKTRSLRKLLAGALQDMYERKGPKQTRSHARKKREHPPGRPKLRTATKAETRAAQRCKQHRRAS